MPAVLPVISEIEYIVSSLIQHVFKLIIGCSRGILIDPGASLSMANECAVENDEVLTAQTVQVRSYDGTTRVVNSWTTVDIQFRG